MLRAVAEPDKSHAKGQEHSSVSNKTREDARPLGKNVMPFELAQSSHETALKDSVHSAFFLNDRHLFEGIS